jgi:hypothetical protein
MAWAFRIATYQEWSRLRLQKMRDSLLSFCIRRASSAFRKSKVKSEELKDERIGQSI